MGIDVVTLALAKGYTDEKIRNVDLTEEEYAALVALLEEE